MTMLKPSGIAERSSGDIMMSSAIAPHADLP
jgi:hypothetical protein